MVVNITEINHYILDEIKIIRGDTKTYINKLDIKINK